MKRSQGREIHGILLLDKPKGMSSNYALQRVKRLYKARKAGHTGALDPLATGMLPICLGESTKFSQFLLDADKRYHVIAQLGIRTDTSDAEGKVVMERPVTVTKNDILAVLPHFRGDIVQVPSMYSALKHQGRPLYEYARQGITVEREARPLTIYELELLAWDSNFLELEVHCSKGTYIRTLIDDIGEQLQCGAHVTALRRLEVANYPVTKMVTMETLQAYADEIEKNEFQNWSLLDSLLLPMDSAVKELIEVNISSELATLFKQGQTVRTSTQIGIDVVRVTVGKERQFIGIGKVNKIGELAPKRLAV